MLHTFGRCDLWYPALMEQSNRERRDQLLDDLQAAVDEWGDAEEKRINDEVSFMKSVLKGRTGSERLASANSAETQSILQHDVEAFLAGSS